MSKLFQRTVVVAFVACAVGCQKAQSYSPAPLQGGESITYSINSTTVGSLIAKVAFDKTPTGFFVNCDLKSCRPQKVGFDLMDGRTPVRALGLGLVWLPPEVRAVGSKIFLGKIVRHEKFAKWQVAVLSERNGQVMRRFDLNTGFLVHLITNAASAGTTQMARVQRSTIRGL